ncbi:hypothetical protein Trydic_g2058 [Trypoxylus dichotomus]
MRDESTSSKLTNVSQIPKKFGNSVFGFSHFIILPEESSSSKCRHFLRNLEGSCGLYVSSIGTETKYNAQIRGMKKDQLDSVVERKDIFMAKKRLLFKKITNMLKTAIDKNLVIDKLFDALDNVDVAAETSERESPDKVEPNTFNDRSISVKAGVTGNDENNSRTQESEKSNFPATTVQRSPTTNKRSSVAIKKKASINKRSATTKKIPATANKTTTTFNETLITGNANETSTTSNITPVTANETSTTSNITPVTANETLTSTNKTPATRNSLRRFSERLKNNPSTGRKSKYLRYLECYWKERGIEVPTDDIPSKKRRRVAVNDLNVRTKRRKLFSPDVWLTWLSEETASDS